MGQSAPRRGHGATSAKLKYIKVQNKFSEDDSKSICKYTRINCYDTRVNAKQVAIESISGFFFRKKKKISKTLKTYEILEIFKV